MRRAGLAAALAALTWLLGASLPRPSRAEQGGTLSGTWVMAQLTTTRAKLPFLGQLYATSLAVTLHRLQHETSRLFGPGRVCKLELDSGSRWVRTRLPAAARAHLPPPQLDARLSVDGRGTMTIQQGRRLVVVGARLRNPSLDPLPRLPSDPAVFDEDRDGRPGLTIQIDGIVPGRVYVAQRSWTELFGRSVAAADFAGAVRFGNEQVILDATSARLARAPVAEQVPERSWFRLVRVADAADCAAASALAERWLRESAR